MFIYIGIQYLSFVDCYSFFCWSAAFLCSEGFLNLKGIQQYFRTALACLLAYLFLFGWGFGVVVLVFVVFCLFVFVM